jgi:two-component system response regulator GlrR
VEDFARLNLVGESPAFLRCLALVRKYAACHATVLVQGETGTGKELAARAIHYLGGRSEYPFIPVNCGAIPETLVENELFGHAPGAFTDARDARCGVIADAEGGTLFLDEVEALSFRGQVALLRFLQDRQYRPLGARRPLTANVRVIAAANENLNAMVERGQFRRDLFFRLRVMSLEMPPLRERGSDAVLLAEQFLRQFSCQ